MTRQLRVRVGGFSGRGVKEVNQDAFAAQFPEGRTGVMKGGAAAIADGVSSCSESHVASQTAVTSFIADYLSTPDSWSVQKSASRVLSSLNGWLWQQNSIRHTRYDSMLTTFSAVILKSHTLYCLHVGDSRIHQLRGGNLDLLTQDHVRREQGREFLSRALGADSHLEVDFSSHEMAAGDLLLLTTDGVHGVLAPQRLRQLLGERGDDLEQAARAIVEAALAAGSTDNVTALLIEIDELPLETLEESHRRLSRLPIPPVLEVGNKLDGYEVLDIIFSGTRSHMYLVRDIESRQQFVLKTPSQNFADDAVYLDGFVREEWVGQCIDHPNVMKTYAPLREKQFLYYLGEYIEGMNLRQWMQDHPQPPLDEVRAIVRQIVLGLRAFQRADMVHQDLKPDNIMLDREGRIRILDFGTVLVAGESELVSPLDKSIPQGTVNYVAPEYLLGLKGSFRSDLFSLGVIVYEMLTGQLPYKEPLIRKDRIDTLAHLEYIPATRHRRDLPLWMEGALRKALQPDPRDRYEAFSEFLQDLCVPNARLQAREQHRPLIARHPLLVWQLIAGLLLLLNLLQLGWRS